MPLLKKLKKFNVLVTLLLAICNTALANITVKHTPIPGGIAVIDFTSTHPNPKAFYGHVRVYVQPIKKSHWQALVGIPLGATAGEKYITIEDFSSRKIAFQVQPHHYKTQHIKLTGDRKKYVNPQPQRLERIARERVVLSKARKSFSAKRLANGQFSRPVDGVTTSPFGLKRFYNNQPRRAHTGLDYAGSVGTPITTPADGRVILTGAFFFNGNTVFLDHGQGLVSVYIHLDDILVESGQRLTQGEVLGTVGQTGRATGPHLHWGVYLNQTAINPNLLLQPTNDAI